MWWGSAGFLDLMTARIAVDLKILQLGYSVLSTDADVVWMRDPIPFMLKYPDADILFSNDQLITTAVGEELEAWPRSGWSANAGFKLLRPSAAILVKRWLEDMNVKVAGEHDQIIFDRLIFRGASSIPGRRDRLFRGFDGLLKVGSLPVGLFCSGQTFKEHLPQLLGVKPYVVHATFQACPQAKVNRLREYDLWKDEEDHYRHPVGFTSYDPDIPQHLLDAVASQSHRRKDIASTLPHFALVNRQLTQLRAQLILSAELGGAAAILPLMASGMDYYHKAHNGTLPGSHLQLPFTVPSDQILDMRELDERLPNGWRERSFLSREGAAAINASRVTLVVCTDEEAPNCSSGEGPAVAVDNVIRMQAGRTLEQLRVALAGVFDHAKVLHVTGGMDRLMTLNDSEVQAYSQQLNTLMSSHCCVKGSPGTIGYDLFWDVPGHLNRHGVRMEGAWKPVPEDIVSCT